MGKGIQTKDNELVQNKFMRYEYNRNNGTMSVLNCMTNKYVHENFEIDYEGFRNYVLSNSETDKIGDN